MSRDGGQHQHQQQRHERRAAAVEHEQFPIEAVRVHGGLAAGDEQTAAAASTGPDGSARFSRHDSRHRVRAQETRRRRRTRVRTPCAGTRDRYERKRSRRNNNGINGRRR